MNEVYHRNKIVNCTHHDPFSYLGLHYEGKESVIRVFEPIATSVKIKILTDFKIVDMEKIDERGFYEFKINKKIYPKDYKLIFYFQSEGYETYDLYSFPPVISDYNLYLFNQGKNKLIYNFLGSHIKEVNNIKGVLFAVWAPNAEGVCVVGDFNGWNGCRHQMRVRGESGVWELFIPHLKEGIFYKYEIITKKNERFLKSDPYGFYFQKRPETATIVYDIDTKDFAWNDDEWLLKRGESLNINAPISIYEVHLGSWKKGLDYRKLAIELTNYVKKMNFTHIEIMPILEHPLDDSWGYQVTGYYAPTSRFGEPKDFKYFVNYLHENNIGVILDWVPGHFPKDPHGLAYFDGTHLYEHEDPKKGYHPDWDTYIFNYGRNEVRNFLISNALFWFEKYHIDGLRIDAVASMLYLDYSRKEGEWEPNIFGGRENLEAISFLQELNSTCYSSFNGISMIAEESTAWPGVTKPTYVGGLGFGYKWNMGWMNDTLFYFSLDPIYRKYHHNKLTFSICYAFSENFILVLSHDEVVHLKKSLFSKMPGDEWQKFANLRLLFGYMWMHPGKKLNFMGNEIGQKNEWDFKSSIDWDILKNDLNLKLQKFIQFIQELNKLYLKTPPLYELDSFEEGFSWIDCNDSENSVISFMRKDSSGEFIICVFNFTPVVRYKYKIGVPKEGKYIEIFNSDSEYFGGSNVGNLGFAISKEEKMHGFDYSLEITLPPLAMVLFKRNRGGKNEETKKL